MLVTIPVRRAELRDREPVLEICRRNHKENGQFSLSMTKVESMVDKAFNRGGAIVGLVGGHNRIEGAILLSVGQFWYTDDWCVEEIFNYVHPEFRKSTHARDMIDFGKRCSDELAIPLVIGVVSNERTRAKMELYRRRLGEPVGGYFIHRPASAAALTA
jgi:hypothetical protein